MPESPVEDWLDSLSAQMARSPTFFAGRPVIVDLSALVGLEAQFEELIETLENRDIRIIGVEGAAPGWTDSEVWGRPPIATNGRARKTRSAPSGSGRAIAGFTQPTAGVFCRKMEAELIAIDGVYKVADDMDPALRGKAIHATLEGDSVVMVTMA
jgi:septum site-determining protein MinC